MVEGPGCTRNGVKARVHIVRRVLGVNGVEGRAVASSIRGKVLSRVMTLGEWGEEDVLEDTHTYCDTLRGRRRAGNPGKSGQCMVVPGLPPPPFLSRDPAACQTTPPPPMSAMPVRGATTLTASRRFRPAARRRPPEARGTPQQQQQ